MDIFDYSSNTINYKDKQYPFRTIWFSEYNDFVTISTTDLNDRVFNDKGYWPDGIAEYIDNQIIFYVSRLEIYESDEYLLDVLNNDMV